MAPQAVSTSPSESHPIDLNALAATLSLQRPLANVTTPAGLSLRTDLKSADGKKAQGLVLLLQAIHSPTEAGESEAFVAASTRIIAELKALASVNPEAWQVIRAAKGSEMGICQAAVDKLKTAKIVEGPTAKLSADDLPNTLVLQQRFDAFTPKVVAGIVSRAAELNGPAVVDRICTICQSARDRRVEMQGIMKDSRNMLLALATQSPGAFEALVARAERGDRTADTAASVALAAIKEALDTDTNIPSPQLAATLGKLGESIRLDRCGELHDSPLRKYEARLFLIHALDKLCANEQSAVAAARAQILGAEPLPTLAHEVFAHGQHATLKEIASQYLAVVKPAAPAPSKPTAPAATAAPSATSAARSEPARPELKFGADVPPEVQAYIENAATKFTTRAEMVSHFAAQMDRLRSLIARAAAEPEFVGEVARMGRRIEESGSTSQKHLTALWVRQLLVYWSPAPAYVSGSPHRNTALEILKTAVREDPSLLTTLMEFASPFTNDGNLRSAAKNLAPILAALPLDLSRVSDAGRRYLDR
ncbi:MAG: hypothetical protein K1X79_06550 [Oligoflexia bacterium]|nr:hypothetical protein [Oligoflexia bacterium]